MTTKSDKMREPDAGPVSAKEAREIAQRFIDGHFREGPDLPRDMRGIARGEGPRISIPADPKRDDDIRLVAFIEQSAAEIERLREDLEGVKEREREHVTRAQDVADEMRRERDRLRTELEALRDHAISSAAEQPYSNASSVLQDIAADLTAILTGTKS